MLRPSFSSMVIHASSQNCGCGLYLITRNAESNSESMSMGHFRNDAFLSNMTGAPTDFSE